MVSYKLSDSCFPTHWKCYSCFIPRQRKPLLQLSKNFWVKISLSREPLVLHPVCRKDQAYTRKCSVRWILTFLGVGHICTLKTKKYQWSNSFSCTWVLGNHCAGSQGPHSHRTGPDVNAIQRHACMLTNHFWQGACRMSGGVNRPFFADFKDSNRTKTNC